MEIPSVSSRIARTGQNTNRVGCTTGKLSNTTVKAMQQGWNTQQVWPTINSLASYSQYWYYTLESQFIGSKRTNSLFTCFPKCDL
eukprot:5675041-Amphidinium_carterae.1